MSPLCYLDGDMKPPLWQEEVVKTYQTVNESLPGYIEVLLNISKKSILLECNEWTNRPTEMYE